MVALVAEIALLGAIYRSTASAADAAAESAASMIEQAAAYDGQVRLDVAAADAVARERIAASIGSGAIVDVTVTADQVCVRVDRPHDVRTLGFIGIDLATVSASSCAIPVTG